MDKISIIKFLGTVLKFNILTEYVHLQSCMQVLNMAHLTFLRLLQRVRHSRISNCRISNGTRWVSIWAWFQFSLDANDRKANDDAQYHHANYSEYSEHDWFRPQKLRRLIDFNSRLFVFITQCTNVFNRQFVEQFRCQIIWLVASCLISILWCFEIGSGVVEYW